MHISVLKNEVVEMLHPQVGEVIVDGTAGGGGHSLALAQKISGEGVFVFIDKDKDALDRTSEKLRSVTKQIIPILGNFSEIKTLLANNDLLKVDKILLDLGWSNFQIREGNRGFSFQKNEPLLMTFEENPNENTLIAKDVVNNWSEENIELIIRVYGQEKYSKKIAKAIIKARETKIIETTFDLTEIINQVVWRKGKLNPATKTFQALRIAVNDEINSLKKVLNDGFEILKINGRMAVISFHSLEDREVKNFFKQQAKNNLAKILTKKPIRPTRDEVLINKKSRSAKLRIIEKIK